MPRISRPWLGSVNIKKQEESSVSVLQLHSCFIITCLPFSCSWWIWRRQSSNPNLSLWTNSFLGPQAECHYSVTWLYVWKDCVCFYIVFYTPVELRRCYRSIWRTSIQLICVLVFHCKHLNNNEALQGFQSKNNG